jgi:hypothetical protein
MKGNDLLGNSRGAFVAALALADGVESFDSMVCGHLEEMGFVVEEILDIEPLAVRKTHKKLDDGILELVKMLSKDSPVQLHVFHAFADESNATKPH